MSRRVQLEEFEAPAAPGAALVLAPEALEEARLAAFENGYRAGWDDAVAAQSDTERQLAAEVGRNLQDLSFTHAEARTHVLRGLSPLLDQICARVLPEVAQAALGEVVRETLLPLAEAAADRPVTLLLNPAGRAAVEAALARGPAPPVALVEEPSLGPGQVFLRFDDTEQQIDLDAAAEAIRSAVAAFFHTEQEHRQHG